MPVSAPRQALACTLIRHPSALPCPPACRQAHDHGRRRHQASWASSSANRPLCPRPCRRRQGWAAGWPADAESRRLSGRPTSFRHLPRFQRCPAAGTSKHLDLGASTGVPDAQEHSGEEHDFNRCSDGSDNLLGPCPMRWTQQESCRNRAASFYDRSRATGPVTNNWIGRLLLRPHIAAVEVQKWLRAPLGRQCPAEVCIPAPQCIGIAVRPHACASPPARPSCTQTWQLALAWGL